LRRRSRLQRQTGWTAARWTPARCPDTLARCRPETAPWCAPAPCLKLPVSWSG